MHCCLTREVKNMKEEKNVGKKKNAKRKKMITKNRKIVTPPHKMRNRVAY